MTGDEAAPPEDLKRSDALPLIYIVGNSHSGSTLLGFLLAANPTIVNLGELKTRSWEKDRSCSCGHEVAACKLYGTYFSTFNQLKRKAFEHLRNINPIRFFLKKRISLDQNSIEYLRQFYTSISTQVSREVPQAKFIVDTSKSVWLLNAWLNFIPEQDIKIIYLKREPKAILASFLKAESAFPKITYSNTHQ